MKLFGFLSLSKKSKDNDVLPGNTRYRRSNVQSGHSPPPYIQNANQIRQSVRGQPQHSPQPNATQTARVQPSQQSSDVQSTFWEPGSTLPLPRYHSQDILIAVMGMTGAGKTSFISKVAGVDMKIGHGLFACTKNIGIATMEYHGQRIHFIDTPGFDDTDLQDAEILETIALYLTGTPDSRIRLSGIIYLHRITDPRVGGTAIKNIRMFRGLVGNRSMTNVALVTTMWGLVNRQDGEMRMNQLMKTDEFWGKMIESGAMSDKYNKTRRDGLRILKMLLQKTPCTLQIQAEMEKGIKLGDTTAGREVNDRMEELKAQHNIEMEKMMRDMQRAERERDEARLENMKKDYELALQKVEEATAAQARLAQATMDSQQAQIQALQSQSWCVVM